MHRLKLQKFMFLKMLDLGKFCVSHSGIHHNYFKNVRKMSPISNMGVLTRQTNVLYMRNFKRPKKLKS